MATVVGFLIAGTVTFGAGEIPADGIYTNDYLLNTFQSTKVVVGKDGNLVINSNGSVKYFLEDLQNHGIHDALSNWELHDNHVVITGALAGQGRFSDGVKSLQELGDAANNLINNQTIGKVLDILKRTNTNDGTPIDGDTNTVIGNENSPVVLGLIGGDMSVGFGKLDIDMNKLFDPEGGTITSSKEKEDLQIIRNGNSTVIINNGNVFGGTAGSTALSLGNISAKGEKK